MLYTDYGGTGESVSRLGMGCMRFERPHDTEDMAQVVLHAFKNGITYFDTAPGYCDDQSEIIVGAAVKEMLKQRQPFYISTKTSRAEPGEIRRQCEESLRRLNVNAIDFYHVWCLVHPDDLAKRKAKGALDEFRKLKEEGLIRHICVSTHLEHARIASMISEGDELFEGVLLGLNASNYSLRYPGVKVAAARGMGVVTMNTLGGGLLTDHAEHFRFLVRAGDRSIVDAAIRFNLSLPGITLALVGFRSLSDVDAAVAAVEDFTPLSAEQIAELTVDLNEAHREFCSQCGYCYDCPAEVPIVRLMDAYNQRLIKGPKAAMDQMRWHWWSPDVAALLDSCTGCGHCEAACTQHLPILARFDELRADYEALSK